MSKLLNKVVKEELEKLFKYDYYGTDDQVANELLIIKNSGIEVNNRETIEEYYSRLYHLTK